MIFRCIAPTWLLEQKPECRRVYEGEYSEERVKELNSLGYNVYFLPNYPSFHDPKDGAVKGSDIDKFEYVFVDMDLKQGTYETKDQFLEVLLSQSIIPTLVTDSGNGVHVYWATKDLDPMSYLRLQRRLCRRFKTDEAVGQIYQLMRFPGTLNTKDPANLKECKTVYVNEDVEYTCEQLDKLLPMITHEDEDYCKQHFDKTYKVNSDIKIEDKIPDKFKRLILSNKEVASIWSGNNDDRSKADYRLGHILFASGFSRDDALSVLVNSPKAISRAPIHRISYAGNIIDKIWTYEIAPEDEKLGALSYTVREILERHPEGTLKGIRLPCYDYLDNTEHGFRLGQVIGLIAGSGVGKTAMALNMFMGFVESNPDYEHFFVPLEQPSNEIADRWKTMCGENKNLYEKVHLLSNYDNEGNYRNLSLAEIKKYLLQFQKDRKKKIGCVVIDHIGALKKKGENEENQGIMDICHEMKAFAVQTNTLLVMQSQSSREKAGIGDLELNKDAAYGTVYFESYCDYLITIWQPLKRAYSEPRCPTVTAYKFCKIRHKRVGVDVIKEDERYTLFFDSKTERLRTLTQEEDIAFSFFNTQCTNLRKQDRKTDIIPYKSAKTLEKESNNV
jgi:hypothetical protein